MVAKRKTALVAHDGVHHRETGAKTAHEPLDEHEPRDNACDGRCLYIYRERGLVTHAGLVFLLLEKDNADDKVEKACSDKIRFAFGDARVQKSAEADEKGKPGNDGGHYGNLGLVVEDSHDMHVQHAHEPGNGVFCVHGETDCDIGEPAGDGDGCRYGLELRIFEVGAQSSEGGDHKYEQPVVKSEMKVQFFQH